MYISADTSPAILFRPYSVDAQRNILFPGTKFWLQWESTLYFYTHDYGIINYKVKHRRRICHFGIVVSPSRNYKHRTAWSRRKSVAHWNIISWFAFHIIWYFTLAFRAEDIIPLSRSIISAFSWKMMTSCNEASQQELFMLVRSI